MPLFSFCEKNNQSSLEDPSSYWYSFFDTSDFNTHHYISSIALLTDGNLLMSSYRRIDFSIEKETVYLVSDSNILELDSSDLSVIEKSPFQINDRNEDRIWYNKDLLIKHSPNERPQKKWWVNDFNCPQESSKYKIDSSGNLWEASLTGINILGSNGWRTFFDGFSFYSLCIDHKENVYVSTFPEMDEPGKILKYDYNSWDTIFISPQSAEWVPCMHIDKDNKLWFGVISRSAVGPEFGRGLYRYNGEIIINFNIYNSGLSSNSVIDIAIDERNNKWIGTYGGGLCKVNYNNEWKIFNKQNTQMPFESVDNIKVSNEKIWLSIQFFGLACLIEY